MLGLTKASTEEESKLGLQPLPQVQLSTWAAPSYHQEGNTGIQWKLKWDVPYKFQACHKKKKKFPQITVITCPVKLLDVSGSEVGVGMVIRSVISEMCSGQRKRKKAFALLTAPRLLRLLQNGPQLQFPVHFWKTEQSSCTQLSVRWTLGMEKILFFCLISLKSQEGYELHLSLKPTTDSLEY